MKHMYNIFNYDQRRLPLSDCCATITIRINTNDYEPSGAKLLLFSSCKLHCMISQCFAFVAFERVSSNKGLYLSQNCVTFCLTRAACRMYVQMYYFAIMIMRYFRIVYLYNIIRSCVFSQLHGSSVLARHARAADHPQCAPHKSTATRCGKYATSSV